MTEEIITDYRQTVQRLQEELKEKSDMIFKLMDYVARLEQENKTNEKQIELDVEHICNLNEQINKLEQENKDLKKQIESDKGLITVGGKQQYQYLQRIDELEQENKELKELNKKICEDWEKEIKVYWNTLEEIREIIYYCGYKDVVDKVLPKINEVLNEKEL